LQLPDKLPLATIAVGIAAAVQAATTTNFLPACAWGFVILVVVLEFAWRISDNMRSLQQWAIRAPAVLFIIPVMFLAQQAYYREFLSENLYLSFDVPHPSQIGSDNLDLDYLILNKGTLGVLIEQVIAIEISMTDFSVNPARNAELCKLPGPYVRNNIMRDTAPHPTSKVLHLSMERPPYTIAAPNFDDLTPFEDDKKLDVSTYDPKTLVSSGTDVITKGISIEAGKAAYLRASFDTDAAPWQQHNVVIICGAIRYLRGDGRESMAVCPAWTVAHLFQNGKPDGQLLGPGSATGFTLKAGPNRADACQTNIP
jgi:hypothetical protein